MEVFRPLFPFLRTQLRYYLLGILALILCDSLALIEPLLIGRVTDALVQHHAGMNVVWKYVGLIVGLAIIAAFFRFAWRQNVQGASRRIDYHLRDLLFRHLQQMGPHFYATHKTGDLMAHATNDVQAVRFAFGNGVVNLVDSLYITLVTIVLMVTSIDWKLTAVGLLPLPLIAVAALYFRRATRERFAEVQASFGDLSDIVQENVAGIRVVKGFVREKSQSEKFYHENLNFMERNMAMARIQGIFQPLVQVISALAYVIVLAYGGYLAIHNLITLGDFVAFNMYLGELVWPMMAIGWVVNLIQRGQASMKRINVLLSYPAEVQESVNVAEVTQLSGQVSVHQLSFQYPDAPAPALSGISFQLFPGKQIGIIGRTGAGKSTLCNLLVRLMEAPAGSIRYDGIDIRQIPLQTLRKQIGYVPQDNFLFSATLRENIAFHPDTIAQEEVVWAAKVAQIYDEIMAMPKQFDTMIGERGITLSGGQKQRVAIARALVKHPRLLLLDDCLSAVDTQTEEKILQGLKQVMPECATLFISHRISSIMDADEILVLEEGQILERGTHAQLLAKGGLYAQLYERQQLEHEVVNS